MKSKKGRLTFVIVLSLILIALIILICIRKSRPKYSYFQINKAFYAVDIMGYEYQKVDFNDYIDKFPMMNSVNYINLYNDMLNKKGKSLESFLSLDEVFEFYNSEFDENGEPKIMNLPPKIEDYLDWFWRHGFSKKGPKVDREKFHAIENITIGMHQLGVYSERKYTNQVSDLVIDNPIDFYIGLYVYNKHNPSSIITEEEMKEAMVGGPVEPLESFGAWVRYLGSVNLKDFQSDLQEAYKSFYLKDNPNPKIFDDLDLSEIKELVGYIETLEEQQPSE